MKSTAGADASGGGGKLAANEANTSAKKLFVCRCKGVGNDR